MSSPNSQKIGNVTPESVNNDSQEASTQNRINNSFILQGTGNSSVTLPANTANPFNNTQAVVGVAGPANTLTVGTVTAGSGAEVTITGNSPNQVINFVLPQASISTTNVSGVYGNASTVPAVTFNIYGQATAVSGTPIAIQANQISGGNLNSGLLLSGSIHTFDIASGTIQSYNLASGVIPSPFALTSGIVESGNIGNAAVNNNNIASGSITYDNIASGYLNISIPAVLGVAYSGYPLEGIYPNAQGTSVLVHNRSNFPPYSYDYLSFIDAPENATSLFYVSVGGNSSGVTSWNVLSSSSGASIAESGSSLIRLTPDGTLNFTDKIDINQLPFASGSLADLLSFPAGLPFGDQTILKYTFDIGNSGAMYFDYFKQADVPIIPADKISGSFLRSGLINSGTLTGFNIASGTLTGFNIASGTLTGFNIASGAIQTFNIASGAIQTFNIASGAITSGKLASGALIPSSITSVFIASGAITSGSVSSGALLSGSVFALTLGSGVLAGVTNVLGKPLFSGSYGPFLASTSGNFSGAAFTDTVSAFSATSGTALTLLSFVNSGVTSGGPIQQWGEPTSGSNKIAVYSDFVVPLLSGSKNADRWYLSFRPSLANEFRLGTDSTNGYFVFSRPTVRGVGGFRPQFFGLDLVCFDGDLNINTWNGNTYLAGNYSGVSSIFMGCRRGDLSAAVGTNLHIWTAGTQTALPAIQINNPGSSGSYSFAVMASGQIRTNQLLSGQTSSSSVVGKMPIYDVSGIFRGYITLTQS